MDAFKSTTIHRPCKHSSNRHLRRLIFASPGTSLTVSPLLFPVAVKHQTRLLHIPGSGGGGSGAAPPPEERDK
ncbi:hypothetical protein E2C01_046587 [Portunus trituberculatus]|uniref:Uncharacterized protein n=1 Tax=Portunus trituberculatus TaxID=210409 RepID=A0A5B7FYZ4_PORTR|nr:hypothetical protein [Portunus trituberculatus]